LLPTTQALRATYLFTFGHDQKVTGVNDGGFRATISKTTEAIV